MPIKIPKDLPAKQILENEGILVIKDTDAVRQDIRPLRIALLNLMPKKIATETQIARLLGSSPLQIEMTLISPTGYTPKNTPTEHMIDFYHSWEEIRAEKFDGLITTGAPIERLPFEEVFYWDELCKIFDWSKTNVHETFNLCWGAQASLFHFYKIQKFELPKKIFGVYRHQKNQSNFLLVNGLTDEILIPVSRYTENRRHDLMANENLEILIDSNESGVCLVYDKKLRHVHMYNHLEYEANTLHEEYLRDTSKKVKIQKPINYYPEDNPARTPKNTWSSNGYLLFNNWLNLIYQTTPFDIKDIGNEK